MVLRFLQYHGYLINVIQYSTVIYRSYCSVNYTEMGEQMAQLRGGDVTVAILVKVAESLNEVVSSVP